MYGLVDVDELWRMNESGWVRDLAAVNELVEIGRLDIARV